MCKGVHNGSAGFCSARDWGHDGPVDPFLPSEPREMEFELVLDIMLSLTRGRVKRKGTNRNKCMK